MKLFDDFEAVRFPEENLILITNRNFIYYIYHPKTEDWNSAYWEKYKYSGSHDITVENYQDVSKNEIIDIMGGIFPTKESDFMRQCSPAVLRITDMLVLLQEDYSDYMSDSLVHASVRNFLYESEVWYKTYLKLRELFENAVLLKQNNEQVLAQIKELSFVVTGRDIFKYEIGIVDGHDPSSYFWIRPVRVIDFTDTDDFDNVAEMSGVEISIEEDDVDQYLTPFLYKYFDKELKANKMRAVHGWDNDGNEQVSYKEKFEWYLTHNFYTFDSVMRMLKDIRDTIDALSSGKENEYISKLREKRGWATYKITYARDWTQEQIAEYNNSRPTEDHTEAELIIDFYQRFIYRMEYMIKIGQEKGFNLISFMGP